MEITVITPTIRPDALKLTQASLKRQTFRGFEWLIGSPFDPGMGTWVKDDFTGGFWTFNRINTKLCKQAKGELIVSLQDSIWLPPDALSKLYTNWKATNGAISGIGDQYERLSPWGKPEVKVWTDPRRTDVHGSFYECNPVDWELNLGCVGREQLADAGYFVDEADMLGYGGDNVLLAQRLARRGVRFYLDQTLESFTLRHGRERSDWDANHLAFNGGYAKLENVL